MRRFLPLSHHSTLLSSWRPLTHHPHCDDLKNLQTLPNVPRDTKSFLVEKPLIQMMYFPGVELCPLSFYFFIVCAKHKAGVTHAYRKEEAALTASLLVQTRQPLQLPILFLSIYSHRGVASQTLFIAQVLPSLLMDNTTWPSLLELEPGGCFRLRLILLNKGDTTAET